MSLATLDLTFVNDTGSTFTLSSSSGCNPGGALPTLAAHSTSVTTRWTGTTQVKGSVVYAAGGQTWAFDFYVPSVLQPGDDDTYGFSSSNGTYVAVISGNPRSGTSAAITVLVQTAAQAVVTLAADLSNAHAFVQSMFASNLRGASNIFDYASPTNPTYPVQTGQALPYCVGFANQASIDQIVSFWLSLWTGTAAPTGPGFALSTDQAMMRTLAAYIQTRLPNLWIPKLQFKGWAGAANASMPVYVVAGYQLYTLVNTDGSWNTANVSVLLSYLVYGAHIVANLDPHLTGTAAVTPDLYDDVYSATALAGLLESGVWDSHYSSVGGQDSGMSYPATITCDTVPNPSPLLCSLLFGPTVQPVMFLSPYDTGTDRCVFLQLEGWRQFGTASSGWHNADYAAYNDTRWNFSTFGTCAFSEKRGTALFLAPAGWTPATQSGTIMPPFVGAQTQQGWLAWNLVTVPQANQKQFASITWVAGTSQSPHFQADFVPVNAISVWLPTGVTCSLWHVNGGAGKDNYLGDLTNGTILAANTLQKGNYNYYVTSTNATSFLVQFTYVI
ncbi:MAG: hypothetical protein V4850_14220 [Myxococcota bacterium]